MPYPWPSSRLSPELMSLLYRVRESSPSRPPITRLIAEAVLKAYGVPHPEKHNHSPKETIPCENSPLASSSSSS